MKSSKPKIKRNNDEGIINEGLQETDTHQNKLRDERNRDKSDDAKLDYNHSTWQADYSLGNSCRNGWLVQRQRPALRTHWQLEIDCPVNWHDRDRHGARLAHSLSLGLTVKSVSFGSDDPLITTKSTSLLDDSLSYIRY